LAKFLAQRINIMLGNNHTNIFYFVWLKAGYVCGFFVFAKYFSTTPVKSKPAYIARKSIRFHLISMGHSINESKHVVS
jgi:uncharacterized protein YneF (UPF0154 family)